LRPDPSQIWISFPLISELPAKAVFYRSSFPYAISFAAMATFDWHCSYLKLRATRIFNSLERESVAGDKEIEPDNFCHLIIGVR